MKRLKGAKGRGAPDRVTGTSWETRKKGKRKTGSEKEGGARREERGEGAVEYIDDFKSRNNKSSSHRTSCKRSVKNDIRGGKEWERRTTSKSPKYAIAQDPLSNGQQKSWRRKTEATAC